MTKTAGSNAAGRHGAGQEHPGRRRGLRDEQVRHAAPPATRVIVLTTFDDDEHLYPALRAGAHGFLAKDATPEEVLDAIRPVADGDAPFSAAVLRRLVHAAVAACERTEAPAPGRWRLTGREQDVLALLGQGLSNAEIAAELHLGVTTVKTHIANLMPKTGATNRVHLAVLAARELTERTGD
ncbi:LuxR C-terminal-related transcriptional regulator [Amycolatopsis thermoflava]|uniref:LuxR C-terminal-related transcriptional regulator n=1 Tax=Amycolatopsis thermoflava TaxID=84480 RepID=UPI003EC063C0